VRQRAENLLKDIKSGRFESPSEKLKEILSAEVGDDGKRYTKYDYDNRSIQNPYGKELRQEIGRSLLESNEETKGDESKQFNISVYGVKFEIGKETTDSLTEKVAKIGSSGITAGFYEALDGQGKSEASGVDKKFSKEEALAKEFNDAVRKSYR